MKNAWPTSCAILVGVLLGGCASQTSEEADPSQVAEPTRITVQAKLLSPAIFLIGGEGDPCIAANEVLLSFPGSQVTLKNSQGDIVALSTVEINQEAVEPTKAGRNEGSNCAYEFSFKDVVADDDFYSIEFALEQISPVNLSRNDLTNGVVINY